MSFRPIEWEKIFDNSTSDRKLISKIYKDLKKLYMMEKTQLKSRVKI